jgi:hypothetical protein
MKDDYTAAYIAVIAEFVVMIGFCAIVVMVFG